MQRLTAADISEFLAKTAKKSTDLYKAYQIAQDPTAWNAEKNRIVKEHEEWLANGGAEEEEEEGEEEAPRKRKAPTAGAQRKKPKAPEPEEKAEPEIERTSLLTVDPATKRVREWRHKLQRAFLNKDGVIVASELDTHDATFKTVEAYTEMTADQLKATKIGKVMKRINQLTDIPRDDEFKFRERAGALMARWGAILGKGDEDAEGDESKTHEGDAKEGAPEGQEGEAKADAA